MHYKKTSNGDQFLFLNNRVNELVNQVEELEKIIDQQKAEISYLISFQSNDDQLFLRDKISILEKENKVQQQYYENIIVQHQIKNQEYSRQIKDDQQKFQKQIEQLEMKIQIILEDNDRLQTQIQTQQNNEQQIKNNKILQEYNQLKSKFEINFNEYQQLKQDKDKLFNEYIIMRNQVNQIKTQYIYQTESLNQKDLECSQLVNEISFIQNQLHTQLQQNKGLKKINDDKTQHIDSLNKQIQELSQFMFQSQIEQIKINEN